LRKISLAIIAACLPLSVAGAPGVNPKPPTEVRRMALSAVERCSTRVTSQSSFKRGKCGTSGCMNALLSCKVEGEAVVEKYVTAAVSMAEDHEIATNCASALSSLEKIATNDQGPSEYDGAAEASFDAGQAVALVRRLAAYELIYIVVKDQSCYVKRIGKRDAPLM